MGDVPGPSTAPYFNQGKFTENFSRLCQLIMTICSDLFRDILSRHIKPVDLRLEFDNNRSRLERIMNAQQKEQIYPTSGSTSLTAKDLDISVLYIILRNICNIPKHRAGWGNPPLNGDKRLSACIERIRIQRNLISAHSVIGSVDDIMFQEYWDELKDAIIEIEKQVVGGDMYERGVNELFSCDLNPTRSKLYVAEFKKIQENIQIKQEKIEYLESTTQTAKRRIAVKKQEIKKLKTTTSRANNHLAVKKLKMNKMEKSNSTLYRRMNDKMRYLDDQLPLKLQEHEQILLSGMQGICREQSEKLQDTLQKYREETQDKMRYLDDQLPLKLQEHERILLSGMQGICREQSEKLQDTLQKYREETQADMKRLKEEMQDMMVKTFRERKGVVLLVTLLPSVLQTSTINVPDVNTVFRISCVTSERLWVSGLENLLQLDSTGNVLQRLDKGDYKDHTVTEDGDLLFIQENKVKKLTSDGTITSLFTTDWTPRCIHSSHITGDILVGMHNIDRGIDTGKVTRYDRTGQKIQDIEKDNQGQKLYRIPWYITENKNGDIWTSGIGSLVVVVDKSGQHRFNYKGQQFQVGFIPLGICTDILGHVLVCDRNYSNPSVHLLDQDGRFLSLLLTEQHNVHDPWALCVDDKHNLYLGQQNSNIITVYKYLQVSEK